MHLLSCRSIRILFILIPFLSFSAETRAEAPEYRAPESVAYPSIGKHPLWLKISNYAADPNLIGNYDLETLGQLWIAELHRKVVPNVNETNQKLLHLPVSDLPNYLNISDVLPKAGDRKSGISEEVTNLAIELVRCYSAYYAPIKKLGAFKKQDAKLRANLVELVGGKAVDALEEDYRYGGTRLRKLTFSNTDDFLKLRLNDCKDARSRYSIEYCLNAFAKDLNFDVPTTADASALNRLWKLTFESKDDAGVWLDHALNNVDPTEDTDLFAIALNVTRFKALLEANMPYEKPGNYPPTVGDFPSQSTAAKSEEESSRSSYRAFDEGALDVTCNVTKMLVFCYFTFKRSCTSKRETELERALSEDWNKETREKLVKMVGEEAVRKLEVDWKSNK